MVSSKCYYSWYCAVLFGWCCEFSYLSVTVLDLPECYAIVEGSDWHLSIVSLVESSGTSPQSTIVAQSFNALNPVSLSVLKPFESRRLPSLIPVGPNRALHFIDSTGKDLIPWTTSHTSIKRCANNGNVEFLFCFIRVSGKKTID